MAYLTLKQLKEKYNFSSKLRLYNWVKRGWLKAKTGKYTYLHKVRGGKMAKNTVDCFLVDEESFLEIPTFIRQSYKVKNKK
ncbi:MAG: hypothetical protein NC935_08375 [Candidatus Omnitrophica bacterium]|nr:hypothetical protein [Candidatus Omnitrophota bacterium]